MLKSRRTSQGHTAQGERPLLTTKLATKHALVEPDEPGDTAQVTVRLHSRDRQQRVRSLAAELCSSACAAALHVKSSVSAVTMCADPDSGADLN